MTNRWGFSLADEHTLNDKQVAQVREIAREEMAASFEGVITEIIDRRLAGVPTVEEMTTLFERQQQTIHEFITSTDLYLRRAERKFDAVDNIQRSLDKLTNSIEARNKQMDDVQRDIQTIDEQANRNSQTLVGVQAKYDGLKVSIFGDPDSPEYPSLIEKLNKRGARTDEQHEEIKTMLTQELKPMIQRANERLIDVELFIAKQRQWAQMGRDAVKFVAQNLRWIAVIAGGGTGFAILIEAIKAVTG